MTGTKWQGRGRRCWEPRGGPCRPIERDGVKEARHAAPLPWLGKEARRLTMPAPPGSTTGCRGAERSLGGPRRPHGSKGPSQGSVVWRAPPAETTRRRTPLHRPDTLRGTVFRAGRQGSNDEARSGGEVRRGGSG